MTSAPSAGALHWDDLRIALAIAEHGSLSGAAANLHISHPTLSRRLQLMERRLGTRLFERRPNGLTATAAGDQALQLARRLREEIAALERRIGGLDSAPDGPVRVTAPDAVAQYLLSGLLASLCREHPGLTIDLIVANQVLSLAQREADIALRVTEQPAETLRGRRVGTVAMAVYASGEQAAADGADPGGTAWVGFDGSLACSGPGAWLARHVDDRQIRFRANTLLGAAQAVSSGLGRGVLPCFVGAVLPGVVRIGPPLEDLAVPLWLLMHPDVARLPRIRRAGDALVAQIGRTTALLRGDVEAAPSAWQTHGTTLGPAAATPVTQAAAPS